MTTQQLDGIHVLCVDDDAPFLALAETCLPEERDSISVTTTTSVSRGHELLEAGGVDCVVSDYDMPEANGVEFLRVVREQGHDLPFVLFTGTGSEEIASEAISAGVSDYLQKTGGTDQFTLLANRIENLVRLHRMEQRYGGEVSLGTDTDRTTGHEREAAFDALAAASADGIIMLDTDSVVRYANPAVERILGYRSEALVGSTKMKIIPERLREAHAKGLQRYLESGTKHFDWTYVELPGLHRDGHEVPLAISLNDFFIGEERYFVGTIRDISARKEAERELQHQNERLSEFASIVSHDLRSPLNVAQGRIELAQDERESEHLAQAVGALDRAQTLIDDLLRLARDGDELDATEAVDLASVVAASWETVETADAELVVETERRVVADRSRLRQLLENLFRNAVEHCASPVTVTVGDLPGVSASRASGGSEDEQRESSGGFYVADDGPGIPAEHRDRVFEAGESTSGTGHGLGLSIVREIVHGHGWEVTITEDATGGARFEFTGVGRED